MATLGRAYIEVHADTKPFNRGLKKQVAEDLAEVEKATKKSGERAGKDYSDALGEEIHDKIPKIVDDTQRQFGRRKLTVKTTVDVDRSSIDRVENFLSRAFRAVGQRISAIFTAVGADASSGLIRALGNGLANVGQAVTGLGGGLGTVALGALILTVSAAVIVLIDTVVALAGALFLLPGAIALVAGAFFVLQGAFGALDDKHATANVKRFAKEWERFGTFLDHLRRIAGHNLFAPLLGSLDAITRALEGPAGDAITSASASIGRLLALIAEVFASPTAVKLFTGTFVTLGKVFDTLGPPFARFVEAFMRLGVAVLPSFEKLAGVFGDLIDRFTEWINQTVTSGHLSTFIDDAGDFLAMLGEIAFSLADLLDAIFDDSKEDSKVVLGAVKEMIETWTAFFREPEGKAFLHALIELTIGLGIAVNAVVYFFAVLVGTIDIAVDAMYELLGLTQRLAGIEGNAGSSVGKALNGDQGPATGSYPGHADGGIYNRPTVGMFGEAGAEAIIPLTNAPRARELMQESGLMSLAADTGDVTLVAYIGGEKVDAHIDRRVGAGIGRFASDVSYVSRPGVAY